MDVDWPVATARVITASAVAVTAFGGIAATRVATGTAEYGALIAIALLAPLWMAGVDS